MSGGDVDIDSKGTKGRETPVPFGHLPAGLPQDPATEQDDKVAFFGNGNELAGQYKPAFRVIPANQCFKSTNVVIDTRNDWLVMDDKLLRVDGFAQTGLGLETGDHTLPHHLVEELRAPFAVSLGVIHGGIGIAKEVLGCAAGRTEGDPDAGGDKHAAPLQVKRLIQPFKDARRHNKRFGLVLDTAEQNGELVSADARHHGLPVSTKARTGADTGSQPASDIDKQLIAGCVSETVVDHLELVKVDKQDGEEFGLLTCGLDCGLEAVDEVKTVWYMGQRVGDLSFSDVRL